jgi:hypothetical protein
MVCQNKRNSNRQQWSKQSVKAAISEVHTASIIRATEAARTFEMVVYFHETTRCYIPEGHSFHNCHHESLKFHIIHFALPSGKMGQSDFS